MGRKISASTFTPADVKRFKEAIRRQSMIASSWFHELPAWQIDGHTLGDETEFVGVRLDLGVPFLGTHVVASLPGDFWWETELGTWNAEHGSTVVSQFGSPYTKLAHALGIDIGAFNQLLQPYHAGLAACGILPSLGRHHTALDHLDGSPRYQVLGRELQRQYGSIRLELPGLDGRGPVRYSGRGIGLEAFTTGRQSHISTSTRSAIDWFNSSVMVASLIIGLQGFSPFLFGRHVSNGDARGLVFAASIRGRGTGFGTRWLSDLGQLISDPVDEPILLPVLPKSSDGEYLAVNDNDLKELTLHLGSRWPFIRLVLSEAGLRWEYRYLPSMPVPDMIAADAAIHALTRLVSARWIKDWTRRSDSFNVATSNFAAAQQHGAQAEIWWPDNQGGYRQTTPAEMFLELMPEAIQALTAHGVKDVEDAVEPMVLRAQAGVNGSSILLQLAGRVPAAQQMRALSLAMVNGINTPVIDWPSQLQI